MLGHWGSADCFSICSLVFCSESFPHAAMQGRSLPKIQCMQFRDVVNAFIKTIYTKGAFTHSVDLDETPHNALSSWSVLFAVLSNFLLKVDNLI